MITTVGRRLLTGLLIFGSVSAAGGGVLGVAFNGAGVPLTYLNGTPFSSYIIPGLILGVVIGGTQAAAAAALIGNHPHRMAAASIAGFGMIIWIFVELAIITEYSFLQTIYFALGIAELALVFVLAGVLAPLTRQNQQPVSEGGHR